MWLIVCFSTPQSHSGEFSMPHLCKKSAHQPWEVRTLLSVHHMLRGRSKPGGVCPGDILHRRLSCFTAAVYICFQLAIISKLVLIKSIVVYIGEFLDFNRFLTASSIKPLIASSRLMIIFENFLIKAFAL